MSMTPGGVKNSPQAAPQVVVQRGMNLTQAEIDEFAKFAERHEQARIASGGLFKHEELTTPSGRRYARLAVGSGGATCYDLLLRRVKRPSSMAVFPCTP